MAFLDQQEPLTPGMVQEQQAAIKAGKQQVADREMAHTAAMQRRPSAGTQKRRIDGSYDKQSVFDSAPPLAPILQNSAKFQSLPPEKQQEFIDLYHNTITRNTTSFKSANPDRQAQMISHVNRVPVEQQRQAMGMPSAPEYTTPEVSDNSAINTAVNIIQNNPMGQAVAAMGRQQIRTRPADTWAEKGAEFAGNTIGSLAAFGAGTALGVPIAAAGASPFVSGLAGGAIGGLAQSAPQDIRRYQQGELSGLGLAGALIADALGGAGTMGTAPIVGNVTRNLAQTGVQTLADIGRGTDPTIQDVGINLLTGIVGDHVSSKLKKPEVVPIPDAPVETHGTPQLAPPVHAVHDWLLRNDPQYKAAHDYGANAQSPTQKAEADTWMANRRQKAIPEYVNATVGQGEHPQLNAPAVDFTTYGPPLPTGGGIADPNLNGRNAIPETRPSRLLPTETDPMVAAIADNANAARHQSETFQDVINRIPPTPDPMAASKPNAPGSLEGVTFDAIPTGTAHGFNIGDVVTDRNYGTTHTVKGWLPDGRLVVESGSGERSTVPANRLQKQIDISHAGVDRNPTPMMNLPEIPKQGTQARNISREIGDLQDRLKEVRAGSKGLKGNDLATAKSKAKGIVERIKQLQVELANAPGIVNTHSGLPLSKILRATDKAGQAIFKAMGLLNDAGEFKVVDAYRRGIARMYRTPEDPTTLTKYGQAVELAKSGTLQDYGLKESYKDARDTKFQETARIVNDAQKLFGQYLKDLSPDDMDMVHEVLTNENADPGLYGQLRDDIRGVLDHLGQRLVKAGALTQESFDRNRGAYLARAYREYETKLGNPSGEVKQVRRAMNVALSQFKGRGTTTEVAGSTLARMQQMGTHAKTHRNQVQYKGQTWEVVAREGDRYTLRRDWTKAEREKMGEIAHAGYAFVKTMDSLSKNVPTFEMYQHVAAMPDVAVDARKLAPDQIAQLEAKGWKMAGDSTIQTSETKRWGALAGHLVDPYVHRDLIELQKLDSPKGIYKSLIQFYKKGKTVWNPASHINNIVGNVTWLELNGGNMDQVIPAFAARIGKGSPEWQQAHALAQEMGVYGGGNLAELKSEQLQKALGDAESNPNASTVEKIAAVWNKADNFATNLYGSEDDVFRLALFKQKLDEGLEPKAAAKVAHKAFIDYNITAPVVNQLRNSIMPFLSWSYRAVPLAIEGSIARPWKVAKMAALWQVANMAMSNMAGGDEEKERAAMVGTVRNPDMMMRTPFKGTNGQSIYADTTRMIPFGEVASGVREGLRDGDPMRPIEGLASQFGMGGPLATAFNAVEGYDPLKDEKIRKRSNTRGENASATAAFIARDLLPPWAGGSSLQRLSNAIQGNPDAYGRTDTIPQATANLIGLKNRGVDVQGLKIRRGKQLSGLQSDLRHDLMKAARDYQGRPDAFAAERDRIIAKMKRAVTDFQEYTKATQEAQ